MFIKSLLAFHLFAILAFFLYSKILENKNTDIALGIEELPDKPSDRQKLMKDNSNMIKTMMSVAFVLACVGSAVTLLLTLKGAADRINK
jgi:hypothetical protein